jgi:prephenate dehydratase
MNNEKKRIVIQGVEGCFHHLAAKAYYGDDLEVVPADNFDKLVKLSSDSARSEAGIMAIENSIAGSILPNYGLLQESGLVIEGEIFLRIKQNLMALPGQKIEDLREVHSHPMAIYQCRNFFRQYPNIKLVEAEDTSLSAKNIREHMMYGVGAIAGDLPAALFQLEILGESIQSIQNNQTRFFVLKRKEELIRNDNYNKASIYFNSSHEVGSLSEILKCIADEGINLSKLQSHPTQGTNWEYFFHLDLEFEQAEQFQRAMDKISPLVDRLRVLGTYQKGMLVE